MENEYYGRYPIEVETVEICRDPKYPLLEFYQYRHKDCPAAGRGWLYGLLPHEQPLRDTIWLEPKPLLPEAVTCPGCGHLLDQDGRTRI
jgi:hypothetical protein